MSQLIDFYAGVGADHRGRTLDEILARDDDWLERTHDYIQWLFPLVEPSRFNPDAPLLTDADRAQFQRRPELRANMERVLQRMMRFYGFSVDDAGKEGRAVQIVPLSAAGRQWLSPGNHNYLRITRILTSLRLVSLNAWAEAFFAGLSPFYQEQTSLIGAETFAYWKRAVES
jgi:hypothetical protein